MNQILTGSQTLLRQQNLAGIMHHLYENAPISRAQLAKLTGLNKATVSSLIGELIQNQFVREVGQGPSNKAGRRSVLLDINPARGCIVSAEIGVDFISVIATNFAAEIVWRQRDSIDSSVGQQEILRQTLHLLHKAVDSGSGRVPLLGIALGVPGLVDWRSGRLLFAPNLGWRDVPLRDLIANEFRTMVVLENEATLAALGEQYFGAAEGYNDVLCIVAGVGVGGGMVVDGRPYNGSGGFAGEFGHMTMDAEGEVCNCGNRGCWETQVSQAALLRHIVRAIENGASSRLGSDAGGDLQKLTVPMVVDAASAGDKVALAALREVGRHLGIGIASLVNALNPSLVVLAGSLSLAGEFLLPAVTDEFHKRALKWTEETTKIVTARYGPDATVMGGVARIYQTVLANPSVTQESKSAVSG
jgi:glucokinase-like ROK family protein